MARQTSGVIAGIDRLAGRSSTLLAIVGSIGVVVLVGIIVVSVFWRYALNDPIFGTADLSVMTLTLVAGSAVAFGARNGAHVSVDIISKFAGPGFVRVTDVIMRLAAVFISGLATYALFSSACGIEKACITNDLSIEHWPFYYYLGVCLGLFTLNMVLELLKLFQAPGDDQTPEGAA
ncbi:MAG: TRAP transporter small permease [Pseudomonadota bacterium]